jgi:hypothetical protein
MKDSEKEDAKVRGDLQRIGQWIKRQLPEKWIFVLLCTPVGKEGRCNYIANARRSDAIRLLHEFIEVTKDQWAEHVADVGKDETDTELGRLRQRVAALELELEHYRSIVEPGAGKTQL